jgi:hypothetical protein
LVGNVKVAAHGSIQGVARSGWPAVTPSRKGGAGCGAAALPSLSTPV